MATFIAPYTAYGESQALVPVLPMPAAVEAAPGVNTRGVLGQIKIAADTVYMLTGIIQGNASWTSLGGADGAFNALVVTTTITAGGNISSLTGNVSADEALIAGTTVTAGGNITSTGGNITATAGNVVATAGNITATAGSVTAGTSVYVEGDGGAPGAGVLGLTNTVDNTQGAGALTLVSANGNDGVNTGFVEAWIGAQRIFIPYFDTITPA